MQARGRDCHVFMRHLGGERDEGCCGGGAGAEAAGDDVQGPGGVGAPVPAEDEEGVEGDGKKGRRGC
jgi:hypothetical protein